MSYTQTTYLSYKEVMKRHHTATLRQAEIPIEHAVSLPMPTKRWLGPAYTFFASPALRRPGQPMEQGVPDRWWVIDAHGGHLIIYTLWRVMAYAQGVSWTTVTLPRVTQSIAEQQAKVETVELLMETLVPAFFANEQGEASTRKALLEVLQTYIPAPLLPQYRALTPDFFAWLEA
jgi:hypothetical protein